MVEQSLELLQVEEQPEYLMAEQLQRAEEIDLTPEIHIITDRPQEVEELNLVPGFLAEAELLRIVTLQEAGPEQAAHQLLEVLHIGQEEALIPEVMEQAAEADQDLATPDQVVAAGLQEAEATPMAVEPEAAQDQDLVVEVTQAAEGQVVAAVQDQDLAEAADQGQEEEIN